MSSPRLQQLAAVLRQLEQAPEPDTKGRVRARLLAAAMELFQVRGYRATSIDEVARAAGIGKGTVYLHFRNKAELMFHAIVEEKRRFIGPVRELLEADLAPDERLRRYVAFILRSVPLAPLGRKLMLGDRELFHFLDELPPEMRAQIEANRAMGLEALLEGVGAFDTLPAEERGRRTQAFAGILQSSAALVEDRVRGGMPLEEYAEQIAAIVVRGVGAP